jgi:arginase family enzyme
MTVTYNNAPFSDGTESSLKARTGVLGVPYDFGSTTRSTGQAGGPEAVRLSYRGPEVEGLVDFGDLEIDEERSLDSVLDQLPYEVEDILENSAERLIVYGGDDAISYGVLAGMEEPFLIHFDAHDDYEESLYVDHASWVRHAVDDGLLAQIHQEGMRAPGSYGRIKRYQKTHPKSVCMVVDLDVFSPGDAPGVAVPEPFGPPSRDMWASICGLMAEFKPDVLVITELCPSRDHNEITARLAFRIGYHFASM